MLRRTAVPAVVALAIGAVAPTTAAARDYAGTALNIIPSGQYGTVPPPAGADTQAKMYDGLTPLFDQVTDADLQRFFKSERLGAVADGPFRTESVPRKGVTLKRDRFNVPHITGRTRDDVTWAMGWTLAQDRELLLQVGRYPAYLAAIDAPNINAFSLVTGLKSYTPTAQVVRKIRRDGDRALARAGRDGRAIRHDIEVYVDGINDYLRLKGTTKQKPLTRVDIYAVNALAGQIFGEGGGDEPRRAQFLDALRDRVGFGRGTTIFKDLSEHTDPDHDSTLSRVFPYGRAPAGRKGNAVIDAGSYKPWTVSAATARAATETHRWASNFLMVAGRRSTNGHPLFVAGPQIGYFYPGLTLEADVKGPGFQARGATAPGFAGNILIGRGQDYAWSLTSAGSDLVDTFVETLCGSDTRYRYKGRCRSMGTVDAGTIKGEGRVRYRTTVHGPVIGYATVDGRRVALSRKRASHGKDVLWQLPFRDLTLNRVRSAKTFFGAMARSPFTFNAAYADDRDIAMYSAGRLPIRDRRVDPRLPIKGTGEYEWKGFLAESRHPRQIGHPSGALLNWNNKPAPEFAASDENWSYGSLHRNLLLRTNVAKRATHDLASLTGAMNAAATQDLRSVGLTPVLTQLLAGTPAPSARAQRMLELLEQWRAAGSSRLDRDRDGVIDAGPGPAIWDALYGRLFSAVMSGVLGPQLDDLRRLVGEVNGPQSGFSGGGITYLHKDLLTVAGRKFKQPYRTRFCGGGDGAACRAAVWAAIEDAGTALAAEQNTADPEAWRAKAETITFSPINVETIRYTNRPSGIQQVITFTGHRPRR